MDDLLWLVRTHLGEEAELLERDSRTLGRPRAAAGLLSGGLDPDEVARAVRRTNARIVHAHNLQPTLGWRALAAARAAGARVVLHLHQYRLVCAIGVCFRDGRECTRCHGRNTLPGVALNCRGSLPEAAAYGLSLMAWQRRLAAQADAFVVPSHFAEARLRALGAPLGPTFVVAPVVREFRSAARAEQADYALVAARLAPEKGVDVAMEACARVGVPLVVAGDGPLRAQLSARADGATRFLGWVSEGRLAELRAGARVALVPSRSAETFGLAAAEAMAAGVPVAASRIGALPELVPEPWLAAPGDAQGLAEVIRGMGPRDGAIALERARAITAPERIAPALAAVYEHALAHR